MIRLFGELALLLAMIFALLQSILPLWGYYRNNIHAQACARPSAIGQCICIFAAYLLLMTAFGLNDFSIAYVANNSHPLLPLLYRLTAVWGAHEGSILLWILILNIWTIVFAVTQKNHDSLTISILGLISFCFLSFLFFTSNPFLATQQIQAGMDLNPLLQDPGFVIHPPMLYMGYVGFAVAFAITQAALIRGQLDAKWASVTRRFAIAAWVFLTFGITLGSWWAYRVLGWGGFWFWDPVENASLLPWLAGTAFIHVLILAEKRRLAVSWASLLAIITFALSLLGTFLVRSGVLISAHTFANDPARGIFLLLLLAILVTVALAIYVIRMPQLISPQQSTITWLSRETSLLLNSVLLFLAMSTILLGTLYPLLLDALHLGTISVGAPYFNKVMTPLVFLIMIFMGFAPLTGWQPSAKTFWSDVCKQIFFSLLAALVLLWTVIGEITFIALFSLSLSLWIIFSVSRFFRTSPAMFFAHFGFAVLIIGILLSSFLNEERDVRMRPGNAVTVGPYQFFFLDLESANGSNYRGVRANFDVLKNARHVTHMHPEKRIYFVRDMIMTKVDIHPGIFRDLYIALGDPLNENDWSVRVYYKPFIRWIWMGGILMMLGGLIAIINKKSNYSGVNRYGNPV